MKSIGILLEQEGDLVAKVVRDENGIIQSGWVVGHTLYQNQYILLKAYPGELKEYPVLGTGIADIVNDKEIAGWSTRIREQLERDGMNVKKVTFDKKMNLEIEAVYENE